jgi:outer membrane protein assembly factor BamB/tetratricopeptide (TPR) repeat protein
MNPTCRDSAAAPRIWFAGYWALALRVLPLAILLWVSRLELASAQFSTGPIELSGAVTLDEAGSEVRANLERVREYVADRQWDEAVETLRRLMETGGSSMISITPHRFVNLGQYCQVQIAALPDEALTLYRERVDATAQALYDQALAQRDADRLSELVDTMFCSTWGDDALFALGEIELERGHYSAARRCWEALIELPPSRVHRPLFEAARQQPELDPAVAAALDKWYVLGETEAGGQYQLRGQGLLPDAERRLLVEFWKANRLPLVRLAYPNSPLPLEEIRARLVLVSIMEGSLPRAREELEAFRQQHPAAQGRLAGRTVDLAETLGEMIDTAASWPSIVPADDWPTFAGNYARNHIARRNLDLGPPAFKPIALGEPLAADMANTRAFSLRRIGEDAQRLMCHHPLVVGDLVMLCNQSQIFAFDRRTGEAAWPGDPARPKGEIYVDENARLASSRASRGLGVPRFTMTAHEGKLYAHLGAQVTSYPLESYESRTGGYLVCLDLTAQGRLVWKPDGRLLPDDEGWAFEGAPIVDGPNLYIAMRKSDVRPQAHVACFDAATGRRRWRTLVCSAETAGGGQISEITHNLLTLHEGTLYYNTNLGVVAALSTRDGHLEWASLYPRAPKAAPDGRDRRTAHYYRDLNPCVYYRGKLLVAPSDSDRILALSAATGELIWETQLPQDVVHLLGVGHGNLLASGDTLWWIDADGGKVLRRWPDTTPLGHGRGLLMGDQVIWPTDTALYVLDQRVSAEGTAPRSPILLTERGAAGGNLVTAGDLFLIASPDKLYAFKQQGQMPKGAANAVATAPAEPPPD